MRREQKNVIVRGAGKQMDAQQRPMLKVKPISGFLREALLHLRFTPALNILMDKSYGELFTESLHGTAVHARERGSQAGMTVHQCLERLLQRRHIKSGFDPDSLGHVIRGTLRRQLMEKPQALLAVREWIFGWCCERAGRDFFRPLDSWRLCCLRRQLRESFVQ